MQWEGKDQKEDVHETSNDEGKLIIREASQNDLFNGSSVGGSTEKGNDQVKDHGASNRRPDDAHHPGGRVVLGFILDRQDVLVTGEGKDEDRVSRTHGKGEIHEQGNFSERRIRDPEKVPNGQEDQVQDGSETTKRRVLEGIHFAHQTDGSDEGSEEERPKGLGTEQGGHETASRQGRNEQLPCQIGGSVSDNGKIGNTGTDAFNGDGQFKGESSLGIRDGTETGKGGFTAELHGCHVE